MKHLIWNKNCFAREMTLHPLLVVGAMVLLLTSCGNTILEEGNDRGGFNRKLVRSELEWVKETGHSVIFENPGTGKFVQFGWSTLMIDLPSQTLSPEEMKRAEVIMADEGIPKEIYVIGSAESPIEQISFQKHLNGEIERAADLVEKVFTSIYLFPSDVPIIATRIEKAEEAAMVR